MLLTDLKLYVFYLTFAAILGRYPLENLPGFDLPDRVAMFCLPLGAVIESWPSDAHHPSPVFSTFVLTAAASDGDRVYGAAVTFYETMDAGLLNESQREQLLLDEQQSSKYVIAQNKSLCLLSRSPFFSTFKQFLIYLYKMSRSTSPPHSAPIERFLRCSSNFSVHSSNVYVFLLFSSDYHLY